MTSRPLSRPFPGRSPIVVFGLLLSLPLRAHAAGGRNDQNESPPYQPPVFGGGAISLVEAIEHALDSDPNLLLSKEDTRQRFGIRQELSGAFDPTLDAQVTFEHREQELRDSQVKGETDKRNQIRDGITIACDAQQELTLEEQQLLQAQQMPGVDITTDRGFDAQIQLLETLITTTSNQAARAALEQTRANLLQTELDQVRRALGEVTQACTRLNEDLARIGDVPREEEFDIGRLSLRLDKLTRGGILWSPFVRGAYDSTNFIGKRNGFFIPDLAPDGTPRRSPSGIPLDRLIDFGGKNIQDLYTLEVGFNVDIPFLRGRGIATSGPERAAQIDYEASELIYVHSAAQSVLNTVLSYWNLSAAQESVTILEGSVGLQHQLVETIRALIEADELPAAELVRAQGGEANARAQLEGASRDLVTAQIDLLRAIGLTLADPAATPRASDALPTGPTIEQVQALAEAALIQDALKSRLDLQAARSALASGKVLVQVANVGLKPQLDVTLGAWSIARGEDSVSNATDAWKGPSWSLRGAFSKPLGNNSARGQLLQRQSQLQQREISAADSDRLVRLGVVRAVGSLEQAVAELRHAEEAARNFERTVEAEFERLRLSETTLLDAIITEQQRTSARLRVLSARFQVASLLAQLRFETGSLVRREGEVNLVATADVGSLPEPGR